MVAAGCEKWAWRLKWRDFGFWDDSQRARAKSHTRGQEYAIPPTPNDSMGETTSATNHINESGVFRTVVE